MGGGHNRQQRGRGAPKRGKQALRRPSPPRVNLLVYAVFLLLCITRGHTTAAEAHWRAPVRPAAVRAAQAKARTVHSKTGPMATKRQPTPFATHWHEFTIPHGAKTTAKYCTGSTHAATARPHCHSGRPPTLLIISGATRQPMRYFHQT